MTTNLTNAFVEKLNSSSSMFFVNFFTPKEGTNLIRLISKGNTIVEPVKTHFLAWSATCLGEECPICAVYNRLRIEKLAPMNQFLTYVVDLTGLSQANKFDVDSNFSSSIIKIWSFGNRMANQIKVELADPENQGVDLFDLKIGNPLKLVRTGKGVDTQYSIKIVKKPVNLFEVDGFSEEYNNLKDLKIQIEEMKEDTKAKLIDNFLKMKLPFELMVGITSILNEFGINSQQLVGFSSNSLNQSNFIDENTNTSSNTFSSSSQSPSSGKSIDDILSELKNK